MLYVGVDQRLRGTGLCVLDSRQGVVRLETVGPLTPHDAERLGTVRERLSAVLDLEIGLAALMGYPVAPGALVCRPGEIGSLLRSLVSEHRTPHILVPLGGLKKYAVGDRRASKERLVAAAVDEGALVEDDLQAAAYFLARMACRFSELWARQQIRTVQQKQARRGGRLARAA